VCVCVTNHKVPYVQPSSKISHDIFTVNYFCYNQKKDHVIAFRSSHCFSSVNQEESFINVHEFNLIFIYIFIAFYSSPYMVRVCRISKLKSNQVKKIVQKRKGKLRQYDVGLAFVQMIQFGPK
jgi:hypothetical protein